MVTRCSPGWQQTVLPGEVEHATVPCGHFGILVGAAEAGSRRRAAAIDPSKPPPMRARA